MKSKVYFTKELEKLAELVGELAANFDKGEVLVKLHLGEDYNPNHLRPEIAKVVCDKLTEMGLKPFLFDTNTAYHQGRHKSEDHIKTGKKNGFDFCEIRIGNKPINVKCEGQLSEIEIAKDFIDVPNMLVLSHVKGHCDAGFGGAIKNLGMGALTVEEKIRYHNLCKPDYIEDKCTACGTCAELCHINIIKMKNGGIELNKDKCHGCGVCIRNCPTGALTTNSKYLTYLLAEVSDAVLKKFEPKKVLYVNVMEKITKLCDCCDKSEIICDDIGILVSGDIVAIEKASVDMVNEKADKNLFEEANYIDPMEQIDAANKFGLGNKEYEII